MSAYYNIPHTVLMGRISHLNAENKRLRTALSEWLSATDARMALGSNSDRIEANLRVRRAYDKACLAIHWTGEFPPLPKPKTNLKRLDHLIRSSSQLSLL